MVGAAAFGHSALSVHQEAVPPPLLRQSILVTFSDVVIQLTLLITDGLHILRGCIKNTEIKRSVKSKHGIKKLNETMMKQIIKI